MNHFPINMYNGSWITSSRKTPWKNRMESFKETPFFFFCVLRIAFTDSTRVVLVSYLHKRVNGSEKILFTTRYSFKTHFSFSIFRKTIFQIKHDSKVCNYLNLHHCWTSYIISLRFLCWMNRSIRTRGYANLILKLLNAR